jgi:hypothetical protein
MQDDSNDPRARNFGLRWLASFARYWIDCGRGMPSAQLIAFSRMSLITPANSVYHVWYFFSYSSKFMSLRPKSGIQPPSEQMGSVAAPSTPPAPETNGRFRRNLAVGGGCGGGPESTRLRNSTSAPCLGERRGELGKGRVRATRSAAWMPFTETGRSPGTKNPAEQAQQQGGRRASSRKRLVCSQCGGRDIDKVATGTKRHHG